MVELFEPRVASAQNSVSSAIQDRLERIRRAARLLAGGSLSPVQSRHMAREIDRLVGMLLDAHRGSRVSPVADPRLDSLSDRERQVLSALATGESVQEVAHRCNRSPKTINNQRTAVLRKLGLRNTAELTRFAIRTGLVSI